MSPREHQKELAKTNRESFYRADRRIHIILSCFAAILLACIIFGIVHNAQVGKRNTEIVTQQTDLIICLLQLRHPQGNFTNREECQQKINQATQNVMMTGTPVPQTTPNTVDNSQVGASASSTPPPKNQLNQTLNNVLNRVPNVNGATLEIQ